MRKLLLLLVMLMIAGCRSDETGSAKTATPRQPCSESSADFIAGAEALFEKWDDARELAGSTPRADLSGPVAALQEIKREATALESPDCSAHVRESLVQLMESTIDGFLLFMSDDEDEQILKFEIASAALEYFLLSLAELQLDSITDSSFLTYLVNASSISKGIKYRDSTGEFVEKSVKSPWLESFVVPSGFLARIEIPATNARYSCTILFNGKIVSGESNSLRTEDIVCKANAP